MYACIHTYTCIQAAHVFTDDNKSKINIDTSDLRERERGGEGELDKVVAQWAGFRVLYI